MSEKMATVKKIIRQTWRGIDEARRAFVNVLFVILVVVLLMVLFSSDKPEIADSTALVVAPKGVLVEQLTSCIRHSLMSESNIWWSLVVIVISVSFVHVIKYDEYRHRG